MKEFRLTEICEYFNTINEKRKKEILNKYSDQNNIKGWSMPLFKDCGLLENRESKASSVPNFKESLGEKNDIIYIGNELLNNGVLKQLEYNLLTNLQSTITIPNFENVSVKWNMKEAVDGAGQFSSTQLQPMRLTAFCRLSKQMLNQNEDIESFLTAQISQAINQELEKAMFSTTAATDDHPKGLGNGLQTTTISNYDSLINLESSVKDGSEYVYVISPAAKKALRKMAKGNNFVMDNGMIDGVRVIISSNVEDKKLFYFNPKNLTLAIYFDGIEILIDNFTEAKDGVIRIVIHLYCNYAMNCRDSIAVGTIE